jgi:hypothetical protein
VAGKEDIDTELMQLVLAILNSADNLKTNGHHKKLHHSNCCVYRGYEPTNQVIQTVNFLDSRGYKIIKK